MKWLVAGIALQIVASVVVGVRLLALARRTRKLPELCFGSCFLTLGLGFPLSIAARNGVGGPEGSAWMLAGGFAAQDVACLALALAVWRVFRPDSGWAAALFGGLVATFAASLVGQGVTVGFQGGVDAGFWYWTGLLGRGASFAWSLLEAARYARLLGRRVPLGLATPEIADRMRLWAATSGTLTAMCGVFIVTKALGIDAASSPAVLALSSLVGVACSTFLWLTFFPPRAYLGWVAARAVPQP